MKRIAIAAFAAVIGLGMMVQDAEAKRLGGGRTSGMSRDSSVTSRDAIPAKPAAPTQAAAPNSAGGAAAAAAPKPGMSRWLGPLAGLAAGIGLASLFSSMGMGGAMGNILMMIALALAAVFVVRWLMNKRQANSAQPPAGMQYAGSGSTIPPRLEPMPLPASTPAAFDASRVTAGTTAGTTAASVGGVASAHVPADFDVDGFLRQAKLNFVRLQAANDRGDMDDIRQFTSPEMFAEVQLEYQDRGRKTQQTDVIELNADLLDVSVEATRQLASVRFHGQLREQADAPVESFREVWHLSKPNDGSRGWSVVGIQQA